MKTKSLCFRLTSMTGIILLLCSIALTLSASYNAGKQLVAVAAAVPSEGITLTPGQAIESGLFPNPSLRAGVATVTAAKRSFNFAGLLSLTAISVLGTGAVYFATKRALRPLLELSEQMTAITENNLDERVGGGQRPDEVGALCRSFNIMLERLSSSFAAQKRFSANVAHELKTPLATMQASIQVMRLDQSPAPEEYERMLDTVERNTSRLRAIIDDLMRLCDEREQMEKREVPLAELFTDIFSELAPALRERQLQYEVNCGKCPTVWGDPSLLYRAFFNLAENAVKYNREGGSISVSSSCRDNICEIRVRDTGNGIPPEELPLIFEPFYRVNKSRSRKTGGAGLGLSVVKTIIERHGWDISASSTAGAGTEFLIRFYQS